MNNDYNMNTLLVFVKNIIIITISSTCVLSSCLFSLELYIYVYMYIQRERERMMMMMMMMMMIYNELLV